MCQYKHPHIVENYTISTNNFCQANAQLTSTPQLVTHNYCQAGVYLDKSVRCPMWPFEDAEDWFYNKYHDGQDEREKVISKCM